MRKKTIRAELAKEQVFQPPVASRLAKLDAEAEVLCSIQKRGELPAAVAAAALDVASASRNNAVPPFCARYFGARGATDGHLTGTVGSREHKST